MYDCYITFRSITGAQVGSKLLNSAGIYHQLARTPKELSAQGCGYTIRVRRQMRNQALQVLARGNAPYQRVYCAGVDGQMEEMAP